MSCPWDSITASTCPPRAHAGRSFDSCARRHPRLPTSRTLYGPSSVPGPRKRPIMSEDVSNFRLYLLRFGYLITVVLVGANAWPALLNHEGPWDAFVGAGWCLYAAMLVLALWGRRAT